VEEMAQLLDAATQTIIKSAEVSLGIFLSGSVLTLVALVHYYKVFDRLDKIADAIEENNKLLEKIERSRAFRNYLKRHKNGDIDSGEF
jgi:hypothetical protein